LFALLCACAGAKYHVSVSSLVARAAVPGKSYLLFPGNLGVTPDDLQFREFAHYVGKALKERGYKPAASAGEAALAVFISYGVGDPRSGRYHYRFPPAESGGRASGMKTERPALFVPGYEFFAGRYKTYFRYVFLDAYDLRRTMRTGYPSEVWAVSMTSGGSSGDLRLAFPALVAAAKSSIGVDTGRVVEVVLDQSDPGVTAMRGENYSAASGNWREELSRKLSENN
jgi:hypothetical protein